jgi:endonuclease/exonuclease/phosphatase family metal-dependent hydrolase
MAIDAAVDRAQCLGSDHLPVHYNIDLRIIHGIY